jgi:hypothetical protein
MGQTVKISELNGFVKSAVFNKGYMSIENKDTRTGEETVITLNPTDAKRLAEAILERAEEHVRIEFNDV